MSKPSDGQDDVSEVRVKNLLQSAQFARAWRPLLFDSRLTDGERVTYLMLDHRCCGKGKTWVSNARLALDRNTTVRTIQRHLSQLEDCGLISVTPRKNSTNVIVLEDLQVIYGDELLKPLPGGVDEPSEPVLRGDIDVTHPPTQMSPPPDIDVTQRNRKEGRGKKGEEDAPVAPLPSDSPPGVSEDQAELWVEDGEPGLQSDCIDEDDVYFSEDPPEPEPIKEERKPPRRINGSGSPTYMVWEAFWDIAQEKWPDLPKPKNIAGRVAGRLKRDLLGEYSQREATALMRLAVLDWEALQDEIWKCSKRGRSPSVEDVIDLRDDLAPYMETGCTSGQHRRSAYARRFVEKNGKKTETLQEAMKKRRKTRGR